MIYKRKDIDEFHESLRDGLDSGKLTNKEVAHALIHHPRFGMIYNPQDPQKVREVMKQREMDYLVEDSGLEIPSGCGYGSTKFLYFIREAAQGAKQGTYGSICDYIGEHGIESSFKACGTCKNNLKKISL